MITEKIKNEGWFMGLPVVSAEEFISDIKLRLWPEDYRYVEYAEPTAPGPSSFDEGFPEGPLFKRVVYDLFLDADRADRALFNLSETREVLDEDDVHVALLDFRKKHRHAPKVLVTNSRSSSVLVTTQPDDYELSRNSASKLENTGVLVNRRNVMPTLLVGAY